MLFVLSRLFITTPITQWCSLFLGAVAIQLRKVTASLITCVRTKHLHYEAILAVVVNYQITFKVIRYGAVSRGNFVNFQHPTSISTLYQRGITNNMGIKIHSRLPPFIKNAADNSKTFKTLLKKFLYSNSFFKCDIAVVFFE